MEFNANSEAPKPKRRRLGLDYKVVYQHAADYMHKNGKVLSLLAVGLFLFTWFEIRPIHINHVCSDQASANARSLLRSKADVTTDPAKKSAYQSMASKSMYLRTDYESFFKKCLRGYGVTH